MSNLLPILKPVDYVWTTDCDTEVPVIAKGHPRPYRLRLVAEQFRKFAKFENNAVDFGKANIQWKNNCGTVACHGGWAFHALHAIGVGHAIELIERYGVERDRRGKQILCDVNYQDGKKLLSAYLRDSRKGGSSSRTSFETWADSNEELWGGENGRDMFDGDGYIAFLTDGYKRDDESLVDLNAIADRYDDVAYRIEQKLYQ